MLNDYVIYKHPSRRGTFAIRHRHTTKHNCAELSMNKNHSCQTTPDDKTPPPYSIRQYAHTHTKTCHILQHADEVFVWYLLNGRSDRFHREKLDTNMDF